MSEGLSAPVVFEYHLDENGISRKVRGNYLERPVTMALYPVAEKPEGRRIYPYHQDDARFIRNIGAKFIGRAIYRWGGESRLNSQEFRTSAQSLIEAIHKDDLRNKRSQRSLTFPSVDRGTCRTLRSPDRRACRDHC